VIVVFQALTKNKLYHPLKDVKNTNNNIMT